jgi:hypothetical protein
MEGKIDSNAYKWLDIDGSRVAVLPQDASTIEIVKLLVEQNSKLLEANADFIRAAGRGTVLLKEEK